MQSADYIRGDEALLNATQQFDLNFALYNSLTNNIKLANTWKLITRFLSPLKTKAYFFCMLTFALFTKILIVSIMIYCNLFPIYLM